jgi:hypothetical protein
MSIPNRGTAGAVLDATNSGLTRVEGGAVWFPGNSTANSLVFSDTGDTDLNSDFSLEIDFGSEWVPVPANSAVMSWGFPVMEAVLQSTTCLLRVNNVSHYSTAPQPSGAHTLRFRMVRDNGAGGYDVIFDYSTNEGATWTQLGDIITTAGAAPTFGPPQGGLRIGTRYTSNTWPMVGAIRGWRFSNEEGDIVLAGADISDPAATSFVCSSGQTITVGRATSGPVTTLVPAGTVVYINPDDGDTANRISVPGGPTFAIANGEDFYILWCGSVGNEPDGINDLLSFQTGGTGSSLFRTAQTPDERVYGKIGDDQISGGVSSVETMYGPTLVAVVYDAAANSGVTATFGQGGVTNRLTENFADVPGGLSGVGDFISMLGIPGGVSSWIWNKGVGIAPSDAELASIAAALLANANRPPVSTTGTLPPAGHKVRGDRYRASNGHIAMFDGAKWVAQSPATGNIAALLGNNQLLLGAS